MAIAAVWFQQGLTVTTSAVLWTVSSTGYHRDLVINNGGPSAGYYAIGTGVTSAATTSSFVVPTGGSVVLTGCQVPAGALIYGMSPGTAITNLGNASLVSAV